LTKSHIVHPGLQIFEDKKPGEIKLAKEDVPGLGETGLVAQRNPLTALAETGWNPDLDAM
jgi:histone acetyltransferase